MSKEQSVPRELIQISHDRGQYSVAVGSGLLTSDLLADAVRGRRVFVVTSEPIKQLHGHRLETGLAEALEVEWLMVPDGEEAKSIEIASELWNGMLELSGKRDSLVVAFGGGSVGDLAGFVAASFLRGVDFVQIPTTLLAQVDASVGGKVAVDLPLGKNTVGAFHQPQLVIADVDLLVTLDERDVVSGLVESLKMGVILDEGLVQLIERQLPALLSAEPGALARVVARSVRTKANVVERDPFESGERKLLNFGHTLGHAIEVCLAYGGLRHGEAVAYGIQFATRLSKIRGLSELDAARIERAVAALPLPPLPKLDPSELLEACSRDKKATESSLSWVLCAAMGQGTVDDDFGGPEVRRELEHFLS